MEANNAANSLNNNSLCSSESSNRVSVIKNIEAGPGYKTIIGSINKIENKALQILAYVAYAVGNLFFGFPLIYDLIVSKANGKDRSLPADNEEETVEISSRVPEEKIIPEENHGANRAEESLQVEESDSLPITEPEGDVEAQTASETESESESEDISSDECEGLDPANLAISNKFFEKVVEEHLAEYGHAEPPASEEVRPLSVKDKLLYGGLSMLTAAWLMDIFYCYVVKANKSV